MIITTGEGAQPTPPPGLEPRRLLAADQAALQALVVEAGWNQVQDDWHLLLSHGTGIGLAEHGGPVMASAVALPYEPGVGWISMVLVAAPWRRRGAARWLMQRCIEELGRRNCAAVLDATPAGAALYATMGFLPGPGLTRWARAAAPARPDERTFATLRAEDLPQVSLMDRAAFGADRGAILSTLASRRPETALCAWQGATLAGFALARNGRTATQLGPVVATHPRVAAGLLTEQAQSSAGPLLVDAFDHPEVTAALRACGFAEQRRFTRMGLGAAPTRNPLAFAAAGPELG